MGMTAMHNSMPCYLSLLGPPETLCEPGPTVVPLDMYPLTPRPFWLRVASGGILPTNAHPLTLAKRAPVI